MTAARCRFALRFGAFVALTTICIGQCPAPSWSAANRIPGFDAMALASAQTMWDPDWAGPAQPVLVVGGNFRFAFDTAASRIATWDGSNWRSIGTGMDGPVLALTVYNGDLIAGGSFATAGGNPAANIARWTGSSWQPLGAGTDKGILAWGVRALAVYNGELIAGGTFDNAGGAPASKIARWNGSTWLPFGSGMTHLTPSYASVYALTTFGGELIVGGQFTAAGGVPANSLARWNGSAWQTFGAGILAGASAGVVKAVTLHNGDLIAAGFFSTADTVPVTQVARWNGVSWMAVGAGPDNVVNAAASFNGDLIVCGDFSPAGGSSFNRIARWDGTSWQSLGAGLGNPAFAGSIENVSSLAVYGGKVFAVGKFSRAGGVDAGGIAGWNGSSWEVWPGGIYGGAVLAFTEHAGDLVAGGNFFSNGVKSCVARMVSGAWQAVGTGFNLASPSMAPAVRALAAYNGDLYAGGEFSDAGGVPASNVARWSGSSWIPLGAGVDGPVNAMTVYNGELIVGGNFANAGGVPAPSVARWNGSAWLQMGGLPPPVAAFTVWNGVLVAGAYTTPGVHAWNGTAWGSLTHNPYYVNGLATYNGDLVATGAFSLAGSVAALNVARFDGANWWPLGSGVTGPPNVIGGFPLCAEAFGGELIVGGDFSIAGGATASSIAGWNASGWHALESGATAPPGSISLTASVVALIVHRGALFAGGAFSSMGVAGSPFVARWSSPLPAVKAWQPLGSGTGVQIDNTWLIPGHEYFNLVSLDVCAAGPGTGPFGGLCSNNFGALVQQALLPLGAAPFHYLATGASASFGPYPAIAGLTFDVLCIDSVNLQAATLGCLSTVTRLTVQ